MHPPPPLRLDPIPKSLCLMGRGEAFGGEILFFVSAKTLIPRREVFGDKNSGYTQVRCDLRMSVFDA